MSIQAVSWAIEDAPDVPPHLVAILIGLANHADRTGRSAFPSQSTLAHYTRKDVRSVRRDLTQLEELGLIRIGDQRFVLHLPEDKRPVVYDLAMERCRGDRPEPKRRGRPTKEQVKTGGRPRPPGRPRPKRADAHVQNGGTPTSDKPFFDPSFEPPPPPTPSTDDPDPAQPQAEEEAATEEQAAKARAVLHDVQRLGQAPVMVSGSYARTLTARIVGKLAEGWTVDALTKQLKGNLANAGSVHAVLLNRLDKIGAPPIRYSATPLPAHARCPIRDHGGQTAATCTGCAGDAKARADETEARLLAERLDGNDALKLARTIGAPSQAQRKRKRTATP